MNMHNWLEEMKAAPVKKAMPVLSFPCVGLMGINVEELIGSSEVQAKGMKLVAERVPSCASVSMMDLSVEAEAFGCTIRVTDFEVPTVVGHILDTEEDAQELAVPPVGAGRTGRYIEAIRMAKQQITDRPVFAGVIGPFSLAGRLMDVSEIMVNCYDEPEMVEETMEKTTEFLINYIRAYKEAGADGVVMAEPLTGMLSPKLAAEFSEPYVRRIAEACKVEDFLVIYHNCGNNTVQMIDSILRTGCDAYHFGDAINMIDILPKIPRDILVMGNVSPSAQFLGGTPESMRAETLRIMNECCGDYPNFLISSGCDIPPASKWENIDAFFAAVAEYYGA
ncbi:MAG: uroporphyrinogen decarboxylase family protein [Eubacteriales bacterium]|nr:uroporphyrinogen decarboxylase family protein [Eubacteriales bacterium]